MARRNAVTYRRVSTTKQIDGTSLESQLENMQRYCESRNYNVLGHYQDAGKSGRNRTGRPGLEKALRAVCKTQGVLVVYDMSRFARSIVDAGAMLAQMREAGADLAIINCGGESLDTATPNGKFMFNMLAAVAEFESDLISSRVKESYRQRRRDGMQCFANTKAPYGMDRTKDGKLVPHKEEQLVVRRMKKWRRYEKLSYQKIADRLNEEAVPPPMARRTGNIGKWHGKTIQNIIDARSYATHSRG